jgi:hypothetical protein
MTPTLRCAWLQPLWGELEALGPDPAPQRQEAAQSVANRNVTSGFVLLASRQARQASKRPPGRQRPPRRLESPRPAGDPAWPSDPRLARGPGWGRVCEAPSWRPSGAPSSAVGDERGGALGILAPDGMPTDQDIPEQTQGTTTAERSGQRIHQNAPKYRGGRCAARRNVQGRYPIRATK